MRLCQLEHRAETAIQALPSRWVVYGSGRPLKFTVFFTVVAALAIFFTVGCGSSEEISADPPPVTIQTEGLIPTPAPTRPPRPTPTPVPDTPVPEVRCVGGTLVDVSPELVECRLPTPTLQPTPVPTTPTPEQSAEAQGDQDGEVAKAHDDATPTPEPTPTPVPTPTPRFRSVDPPSLVDLPGSSGGTPIFKFSSLGIHDNILSLSGTMTGRADLASRQWTIQVWQSQYEVVVTENCSTEKPIAFIMAATGGDNFLPVATPYEYFYCVGGQGLNRTVDVPWLRADSWSLAERKRRYTTEPRIWDFRVKANLQDERVQELEYHRPAGWMVLIWAGETLIAREWLEW